MDRVRSAFNGVMRSERYSRFTLQPAENGERHAEVKLSDDATDDVTELEAQGSPSFRPAPLRRSRWTVLYVVLGILLIFVIGYVVGYASHQKPQGEPVDCGVQKGVKTDGTTTERTMTTTSSAPAAPVAPAPEPQLNWKKLTQLLAEKLTSQAFESSLREFDELRRSAGSEEDKSLANRIFDSFKRLEMKPWTDIHHVQLPMPDSQRPNRIQFGSEVFKPTGYLAYSAVGRVQGRLVYGNYGRKEDLDVVQKVVELKDSVLLLRAGNLTFAEQVNNAAMKEAAAVLIYPDPQDYPFNTDTELYGHVHLGSGDPYTPGFPSFNHTQFPPTNSSGLPKIPAQTISANVAQTLLKKIGGLESNTSSGFKGGLSSVSYNLGGKESIIVEVNNVLVNSELHNVFGVIKGFADPDRYVLLGAQRDAWGNGYAKANVGTSVLMELAKAFHEMVENDGFRPRRSLVFASWSAGEYGSVGATEWLEGFISSIDRNVITYISLDGVVLGHGSFIASASPLLYSLLQSTMKEVKSPLGDGTVYSMTVRNNGSWDTQVMRPMSMDDPAYPFLAFSGIPSVSFHFIKTQIESYVYYGTSLDNKDHLSYQTNRRTSEMTATAAQFAGQMALRLVHDHKLSLDVNRYSNLINKAVLTVYGRIKKLLRSGELKDVDPEWLNRARSSFKRAADGIGTAVDNTDLTDPEASRILNDRIRMVEHCLLSPYVSPIDTPFRHLVFGRGSHTLASIDVSDTKQLRTQLALATWNLKACANAMMGNVWDIDNEI
ncbi:transferrin receptor 1b [Melanotaenia boesemani]|uniref:transferrin receptor 1b n=1 Tax=Melanotaenia boesemani TaxID=1250792 RepID=UPI001C047C0F|nr:transferrin receptor 1b [Melanotaenia boesemani]